MKVVENVGRRKKNASKKEESRLKSEKGQAKSCNERQVKRKRGESADVCSWSSCSLNGSAAN